MNSNFIPSSSKAFLPPFFIFTALVCAGRLSADWDPYPRPAPGPEYATIAPADSLEPTPEQWPELGFYAIQTELSPLSCFHSSATELALFSRMPETGLGAPAHAAFLQNGKIIQLTAGTTVASPDLDECWIMVWFAGAGGWSNWDSPWAVFPEHRPTEIRLDAQGLHLSFANRADTVLLMPLWGYAKAPMPSVRDRFAPLPEDRHTENWSRELPPSIIEQVRYWSRVSRYLPIQCRDGFRLAPARDTVMFQPRFEWLEIQDDWNTRGIKLAPISPVLGSALLEGFPAIVEPAWHDPDIFTPYGPYLGVEGVDSYTVRMPVLQYIHEWERPVPLDQVDSELARRALKRIRDEGRGKFPDAERYRYDHGGMNNFCWAIMGDQWYCAGLPYYDSETRANALGVLHAYFHDDVLVPERFTPREFPEGSGRTYQLLHGPGIGSWGVLGDSGKFSTNLLQTLWAYAHYSGDWDLIRDRWPLIKQLFCTPAEIRWTTFGREAIAELGDEAPPCIALARMAFHVGDMDTYAYACSIFARELAMHHVKQKGQEYFQQNQPWHSMELMDDEVYLTNLWGDLAGWQIDGPRYPEETGERQFNNRWVRFHSPEVGRFYQDYLKNEITAELDLLTERWDPRRKRVNDSHIMPSLVQLRFLLLNESPAALAELSVPERFGGPSSGVIASAISMIRTSRPVERIRLIPETESTPWLCGPEREPHVAGAYLVQAYRLGDRDSRPAWPRIGWWGWETPAGKPWNLGVVCPVNAGDVKEVHQYDLNWNTRLLTWDLRQDN